MLIRLVRFYSTSEDYPRLNSSESMLPWSGEGHRASPIYYEGILMKRRSGGALKRSAWGCLAIPCMLMEFIWCWTKATGCFKCLISSYYGKILLGWELPLLTLSSSKFNASLLRGKGIWLIIMLTLTLGCYNENICFVSSSALSYDYFYWSLIWKFADFEHFR